MNILLICSAGMSTSLLVTKMEKAAKEKGIDATIWAVSTDSVDRNLPKADVALIGPQIRFQLDVMKEKGAKLGVPVEVIDSVDYGMCNGPKVLEKALKMKK
ncbi:MULTISPECIES: PTS sugar transporter subunit IIB [Clostridium]|jgi:PTS system cellobiose-specific IIB component|uniref:PTS system, lactose/cellobiose family IIB component n=2 Tax=Clostridium intestinale TaxID=36845 RepID=U2MYG1_9CLOT|nr:MULTISPECIES: PTS sugar transporter subunit IIB [Clostridium]ERK28292.1 PTS system, lactose/cellobiose family IIB component [Clostridium intestinale URNW]SHI92779.1 PTS system, cellobiose-specific IIB component [Clostridium intestinale DSM 6191]